MKLSAFFVLLASSVCALDLSSYDEAIRENPDSHIAYYRRATANLAGGRDTQALSDLSMALKIDPKFVSGRLYRAKTHLRLGNYEKAIEDANVCASEGNENCANVLETANQAMAALASAIADGETKEFEDCVAQCSQIIDEWSPKSVAVRRQRFFCNMNSGKVPEALVDLREIVAQDKADYEAVSSLAKILFLMDNNRAQALQLLRRCVSFDPDAKACVATSKMLRQLDKKVDASKSALKVKYSEIEGLVNQVGDELNLPREYVEDSTFLDDLRHRRCEEFANSEQWTRGAKVCAKVRDSDENFVPAVYLQAQLERESGNFHAAIQLLKPLIQNGLATQKVQQLYQECQAEMNRPRSQTPSKDLYKVLGVDKKADTKQIKKAYRELSKQYHPDKQRNTNMSQEEALEKMSEINEAYETLGDEQKRKDYDMNQAGGGGGFQGGFQGGFPGFQGGFQGGVPEDILKQFMQQQGGGFRFG